MDWDCYKRLCDSPPVFSRWMLEQTVALAQAQNLPSDQLQLVLGGRALEKPADHIGGDATDMFTLRLELGYAREIVDVIARASAAGEHTPATKNRGLGGFLEAWREYAEYLQQQPDNRHSEDE